MSSHSHGREFVFQVRPFLERQDAEGLISYLGQFWPNHLLRDLLASGHPDAANVAVVCLGLTGEMADNQAIAPLLNSDDPAAAAYAEYALWSIWFRSAEEKPRNELCQAVQLIGENRLDEAIAVLDALLAYSPAYAEAYNQRAIAWFLKEDYRQSLADCRAALRLNPHHFGAMAGLGHCYASLGKFSEALKAYCLSLHMHPRLEGLRESIHHLRRKLGTAAPTPSGRAPSAAPPSKSPRGSE